MTFAAFVPLTSNAAALDGMLRWAGELRGSGSPVVLVGPSGVGKTHLVRAALALRAAPLPPHRARQVSASNLVSAYSAAIRAQRIDAFRARLERHAGCFVLEHVEDLTRKPESRRQLFAMLRPLSEGRRLVVTATAQKGRPVPSALLRDVLEAFPRAAVLRILRPDARGRTLLSAAALERTQRADAAEHEHAPEAAIARILRSFANDLMGGLRGKRALLMLDADVRGLHAALEAESFHVMASWSSGDDADSKAAVLAGRIVVTRQTERYVHDASVLDLGIIGMDALPPEMPPEISARMVLRAVLDMSLAERRGPFLLLLHPRGHHVFRDLDRWTEATDAR